MLVRLGIFLSAALLIVLGAAPARAEPAARLRVVVVLDTSLSMRDNDPDHLARLAARLLVDLADARDRVTLVSFGSEAKTVMTAGGDAHDALEKALDGVVPDQKCTDYAKGLSRAAQTFKNPAPPGERRLVVFLTDGEYDPADDTGKCSAATKFENPRLSDDDRARFERGVRDAENKLKQSHAKVFVIGLGNAMARAKRSRALLESVAQHTGGRFLSATSADRVPEFFTDVFAALVGAAVLKPAPAASVTVNVPADAEQLHVVARLDDPSASIALDRGGVAFPFGKAKDQASGPIVRVERGRKARGYAVAWLKKPAAGAITVRRTKGQGPLSVWAIADVGTSLRIEKLGKVLPETAPLAGVAALRSGQGKPVARDPSYLGKVTFHVGLDGQPPRNIPAAGRDAVAFDFGRLPPRDAPYALTLSADHAEGFLQVEPAKLSVRVIHQIPVVLSVEPVKFDTMAERETIARSKVRVVEPAKLPATVSFDVVLPPDAAKDISAMPTKLEFGPDAREAEIEFRFTDPEALRSTDRRYGGQLKVSVAASDSEFLSREKSFEAPIDGTLRSWTLSRWLQEYETELIIALLLLLLVVWLIGRAVAAKFPPKARIHYKELADPFESDSLIKRYQKRGAYRSARFRFPLGKKAKPLVSFVASGSGFEVRPEGAAVVEIGSEPETERRKPFRGVWEQRYRLGDRYEVWLTRT